MSAVNRINAHQARDYIDSLYDDWAGWIDHDRAAGSVLRYLVAHAMYDKCADDNYGDVTILASSQGTIGHRTDYSVRQVRDALKHLEELKLIRRSRGGRRAHKPDRISVRPLMDDAVEWVQRQALLAVRDEANRLPDENLVLDRGLVFRTYGAKFQLGKLKVEERGDGWAPTRSWEVWCRRQVSSTWHPSTVSTRKGEWWVRWEESEVREAAQSWWLAEEY